jgi:hypothetical protein
MCTEDGHISIKIVSFSRILIGHKISILHSQKGVTRLVVLEDLPIIVMRGRGQFIAELYIVVSLVGAR